MVQALSSIFTSQIATHKSTPAGPSSELNVEAKSSPTDDSVTISGIGYHSLHTNTDLNANSRSNSDTDNSNQMTYLSSINNASLDGTDKQRFENAMQKIEQQFDAGQTNRINADLYENQLGIGIMALGGFEQVKTWREQGMELSEASILAAGKAFNDGFKQQLSESKNSPSALGVAINRHEIVKDNQTVPEWFLQEQQQLLDQMGQTAVRQAFERGALFHVG